MLRKYSRNIYIYIPIALLATYLSREYINTVHKDVTHSKTFAYIL